MSAMRAVPANTNRLNAPVPDAATTTAVAVSSAPTTAGFRSSPSRRPKRRIKRPARSARKRMDARLISAVNTDRNCVRSLPLYRA
jgi:hypothetical protein